MNTDIRVPAEYEYEEFGDEFEVVEAIGVGIAAFESARSILSSGSLSAKASTVNYIHANTPADRRFSRATVEFEIAAHHPRYGIGTQHFWFRLSFEYNDNDIRNAAIVLLENRSSRMVASEFSVDFSAQPYSVPAAPVAKIVFQINGRWDPVGIGVDSFWGELFVSADGSARASISSEQDWVRFKGFKNRRDKALGRPPRAPQPKPSPAPPAPGPRPPAPSPRPAAKLPTLKSGSRGKAVRQLQLRLNKWLSTQQKKPLIVDGDFGSKTRSAVKAFQRSQRLKPDGIVGSRTWGRLLNLRKMP